MTEFRRELNCCIIRNGEEKQPERMVLKLSDMYEVKEREAKLELQAVMLNISGDNNTGLKEACRTLKEYNTPSTQIKSDCMRSVCP